MNLENIAKSYRDTYGFSVFPVALNYKMDFNQKFEMKSIGGTEVRKIDKQPILSWTPFMKRLPTDIEIKTGFSNPKANAIGMVTGKLSGIVVLDWDEVDPPYKSPVMVKTITGGYHIYYKYREGIRNTVRVRNKTLDVRGEGGFVVIPPSSFGDLEYKWLLQDKFSQSIENLPEFPILEIEDKSNPLDVKEYLNISVGARDDKLYRLACSLLQKHPSDEALELLTAVARTYEGYGKTFNEVDVNSKYEGARKFLNNEGKLYKRVNTSSVVGSLEKEDPQVSSFIFNPKLLSTLAKDDYKIEWLWDGFLAKGHITLFSALWKSGKTTLLAELFRCMEQELPLAGQATHLCKVLCLSEERETQWVLRRDEKDLTLPIHILCNPIKRKLKYEEWVDFVEKAANYCEAQGIDIVIVDTLTTFSSVVNENDSSQVNAALLPLNYLREKNIAVLLVHHFRKSGGDEGTASRGSGALMGYADIIMEFSRLEPADPTNTQRKLISLSRFDETPNEIVLDYVNNEYLSEVITNSREAKQNNKVLRLFEQINKKVLDNLLNGSFTSMEVWEQLQDGESDTPTEKTIRNYLNRLVSMEKLILSVEKRKVGKTEAKLYKINDGRKEQQPEDNSFDLPFNLNHPHLDSKEGL